MGKLMLDMELISNHKNSWLSTGAGTWEMLCGWSLKRPESPRVLFGWPVQLFSSVVSLSRSPVLPSPLS